MRSVIAKPTNLPPETWGILVRKRREELLYTQATLAEAVDVSQVTISRIEKGLQTPRLDLMIRLANVLRVESIDELFPYPNISRSAR